jgi:hypothetical protein
VFGWSTDLLGDEGQITARRLHEHDTQANDTASEDAGAANFRRDPTRSSNQTVRVPKRKPFGEWRNCAMNHPYQFSRQTAATQTVLSQKKTDHWRSDSRRTAREFVI